MHGVLRGALEEAADGSHLVALLEGVRGLLGLQEGEEVLPDLRRGDVHAHVLEGELEGLPHLLARGGGGLALDRADILLVKTP